MHNINKFFYNRLDSTNLQALKLIAEDELSETFWIRAADQYAGRGQGSKTWISEAGKNLTGTLVIFPENLAATGQFDMLRLCALGVCDFLELFLEDVRIKWPNDMYTGNNKIGGILIETAVVGPEVKYAILGIGININQETFPAGIPNPVSLRNLTGITYRLEELEDLLLSACLNRFAGMSGDLPEMVGIMPDPGQFRPEYLKKLYGYKEFAPYKVNGKWLRAKIIDLDDLGQLVLEDESGLRCAYSYEEVEYIIEN